MRELVLFFAALADPTRLRLLQLMRRGPMCVGLLQGVLRSPQPKISRHLAYLKRAGLVRATRSGKWKYYGLRLLDQECQSMVEATMRRIGRLQQAKADQARLKDIRSKPGRYRISVPLEPAVRRKQTRRTASPQPGRRNPSARRAAKRRG